MPIAAALSRAGVKRFWDTATIEPAPGGYAILLDGKPMRLPGGAVLRVEAEPLARAIAEEWQRPAAAKGGEMSFADTPLTRLAGTAQQRIAPDPGAHHRRHRPLRRERPAVLPRRSTARSWCSARRAQWQPWLDWAALAYDAPLRISTGIAYVKQHRGSIAALRKAVAALDVPALAALGIAVPALGSLVLGLALAEGRLDAATAHALGSLDELFQAEAWGEDAEAAARRRGYCRGHRSRGTLPATDARCAGSMNAKRLIISGRVQGVGYRAMDGRRRPRAGCFGLGAQPARRLGGGIGGRRYRRGGGTAAALPPRSAHGRGGQHRGGSRGSARAHSWFRQCRCRLRMLASRRCVNRNLVPPPRTQRRASQRRCPW